MLKTFLNFSGVELLSKQELLNIKASGDPNQMPLCKYWAPPGANRALYPNYPCADGPNEPIEICTATVDGVVCP